MSFLDIQDNLFDNLLGIVTLCCHLVNYITIFPNTFSKIEYFTLFLYEMSTLLK